MTPHVYSIDEFFPPREFEWLRAYAYGLEYRDVVAPYDGVTYRNIGLPVPAVACDLMAVQLTWLLGYKVIPKYAAFRWSPRGSIPPQWAHSDLEVATYGMFVFINPGPFATVLLEHRASGMRIHPSSLDELEIWKRDHNSVDAWREVARFEAAPNRAIILRSELMHAALPREGYGETIEDGRLILLSFFD